jgi:hypothetical protein
MFKVDVKNQMSQTFGDAGSSTFFPWANEYIMVFQFLTIRTKGVGLLSCVHCFLVVLYVIQLFHAKSI